MAARAVKRRVRKKGGLADTALFLLFLFFLALFVRTFVAAPFMIPSGSMLPNLMIGDYLFAAKWPYGFSRYAFPFGLLRFQGRMWGGEPKRGDIVVFRFPPNPEVDYIKRLVGLPGDKIQVTNGVLFINGKPVPKVADGTFNSDYAQDPGQDVPVFRETLDDGKTYDTLDQSPVSRGDNTQEFVVPEGHYFMMGDNRDNSLDSRFDVGFVPAENLVGRASVIFFSLGNDTSFREIWKWPSNMRWDRLFKVVE